MSLYSRYFLILFSSYYASAKEFNTPFFKYKNRNERQCNKNGNSLEPFYRKSVLEDPFNLLLLIFLGFILILMFLGIIKGLMGLFISKGIGEFGMGLLVDLPKPLNEYQEKELKYYPVEYDVGGWPVHPVTKERTVRVLTKKTEFCLNVIFFMAYPLALMFQLCGLCCGIRSYTKENEKNHFKCVNIIKFNDGSRKKRDPGHNVDMYQENDGKEAEDTKYVMNQMKKSQESLQNN